MPEAGDTAGERTAGLGSVQAALDLRNWVFETDQISVRYVWTGQCVLANLRIDDGIVDEVCSGVGARNLLDDYQPLHGFREERRGATPAARVLLGGQEQGRRRRVKPRPLFRKATLTVGDQDARLLAGVSDAGIIVADDPGTIPDVDLPHDLPVGVAEMRVGLQGKLPRG